jgi:hypothetical protein
MPAESPAAIYPTLSSGAFEACCRLDGTLFGVYPSRLSDFRRDGRVVEGAPLLRA